MTSMAEVKVSKWAFAACFAGDLVLLALAGVLYEAHGAGPLGTMQAGLMIFCGLAGAILAVTPFYLEYQAAVRMVETGAVVSMISQLDQLQGIAGSMAGATAQWQNVQESAARTAGISREIADKMTLEINSFKKFMQDTNDGEKGVLKLEIEKLRREQNEFIQIIVRMLDHTYALNQAAARSGQPSLIENLANFQAANRDVARRIGLVPFAPGVNEPFDPKIHQSADSQSMPVSNSRVSETIATGYTYQGALLRPALVALQTAGVPAAVEKPPGRKAELTPAKAPEAAPAKAAPDAAVEPPPEAAARPQGRIQPVAKPARDDYSREQSLL